MAKNKLFDSIYSRIYSQGVDIKNTSNRLKDEVNRSMSRLIDNSISLNGNNMSTLYKKLLNDVKKDDKFISDMENLFNNQDLMTSLTEAQFDNKYIKDLKTEIDLICRYVPRIESGLKIKKDLILNGDVFTKDFLNITNTSVVDKEEYSSNIKELKRKYKLIEFFDDSCYYMLKYGEDFVWKIPYNIAFEKVLKAKKEKEVFSPFSKNNSGLLRESCNLYNISDETFNSLSEEYKNIKVEFYDSFADLIPNDDLTILSEAYSSSMDNIVTKDKLDLEIKKMNNSSSQDGLIDRDRKDVAVNVKGLMLKRIKSEYIIPKYIDKIPVAFFYIEVENNDITNSNIYNINDPLGPIKRQNLMSNSLNSNNQNRDSMLKALAATLSDKIDAKFINKNQDIKREIYTILKYNEKMNGDATIKVTYIPPEQMEHMYFKFNPDTGRGMPEIAAGMIAAKIKACLYIIDTIGMMTRSQDKRVHYIKQTVDTNLSQSMMNIIGQIRQSAFGLREVNSLSRILNIAGRFNDYYMVVSGSGDRPVEFDVIQGQDVNPNLDLYDKLDNEVLGVIGIPLEYIDMKNTIEYSRQLTITNGNVAREIITYQGKYQPYISNIVTDLYNSEYEKNDRLEANLLLPSYLAVSIMKDMYDNVNQLVDQEVNMMVPQDDMNKGYVHEFKKELYKHHLSGYMDIGILESLLKKSKLLDALDDNVEDNDGDNY